jgi:hypothetical protein
MCGPDFQVLFARYTPTLDQLPGYLAIATIVLAYICWRSHAPRTRWWLHAIGCLICASIIRDWQLTDSHYGTQWSVLIRPSLLAATLLFEVNLHLSVVVRGQPQPGERAVEREHAAVLACSPGHDM